MKIKILKSKAVGVHNGEKCRYYDYDNVRTANERIRFFYLYPFLPLNIVLFGQVRRTIFKPYYKVKGYFFGKFNDRNLRKDMKRVKAWIDEVVLVVIVMPRIEKHTTRTNKRSMKVQKESVG